MRSLDGHNSSHAMPHVYWQEPAGFNLGGLSRDQPAEGQDGEEPCYHYWWGLSGRRYRHEIVSVEDAVAKSALHCIFVSRSTDGLLVPKYNGLISEQDCVETPLLMRHHAKLIGASEVHILTFEAFAETDKSWAGRVERDLRAAITLCDENPSLLHPLMRV